MIKWLEAKFCN